MKKQYNIIITSIGIAAFIFTQMSVMAGPGYGRTEKIGNLRQETAEAAVKAGGIGEELGGPAGVKANANGSMPNWEEARMTEAKRAFRAAQQMSPLKGVAPLSPGDNQHYQIFLQQYPPFHPVHPARMFLKFLSDNNITNIGLHGGAVLGLLQDREIKDLDIVLVLSGEDAEKFKNSSAEERDQQIRQLMQPLAKALDVDYHAFFKGWLEKMDDIKPVEFAGLIVEALDMPVDRVTGLDVEPEDTGLVLTVERLIAVPVLFPSNPDKVLLLDPGGGYEDLMEHRVRLAGSLTASVDSLALSKRTLFRIIRRIALEDLTFDLKADRKGIQAFEDIYTLAQSVKGFLERTKMTDDELRQLAYNELWQLFSQTYPYSDNVLALINSFDVRMTLDDVLSKDGNLGDPGVAGTPVEKLLQMVKGRIKNVQNGFPRQGVAGAAGTDVGKVIEEINRLRVLLGRGHGRLAIEEHSNIPDEKRMARLRRDLARKEWRLETLEDLLPRIEKEKIAQRLMEDSLISEGTRSVKRYDDYANADPDGIMGAATATSQSNASAAGTAGTGAVTAIDKTAELLNMTALVLDGDTNSAIKTKALLANDIGFRGNNISIYILNEPEEKLLESRDAARLDYFKSRYNADLIVARFNDGRYLVLGGGLDKELPPVSGTDAREDGRLQREIELWV